MGFFGVGLGVFCVLAFPRKGCVTAESLPECNTVFTCEVLVQQHGSVVSYVIASWRDSLVAYWMKAMTQTRPVATYLHTINLSKHSPFCTQCDQSLSKRCLDGSSRGSTTAGNRFNFILNLGPFSFCSRLVMGAGRWGTPCGTWEQKVLWTMAGKESCWPNKADSQAKLFCLLKFRFSAIPLRILNGCLLYTFKTSQIYWPLSPCPCSFCDFAWW